MPIWRCPHCGTPQAETARCWVCRRSSTTCSTCRQFRRSIAARVGYCGLDRRRLPLAGTELRGCWEAGPARAPDLAPDPASNDTVDAADAPSPGLRLRDFVLVDLTRRDVPGAGSSRAHVPSVPPPSVGKPEAGVAANPAESRPAWADRATLFADAEIQM